MKMDYSQSLMLRALIRKYEYGRDAALANLQVYFEKGVGGNLYNISGFVNKDLFHSDSKDLYFGGIHISELEKYNISKRALEKDPLEWFKDNKSWINL